MKLTDKTVEILLRLLAGERIPASSAKNRLMRELIAERIIRQIGKHRRTLQLADRKALTDYLYVRHGIRDLRQYGAARSRAEYTAAGSDSKHSGDRAFQGFLVNTSEPVAAQLNGRKFRIHPVEGSFLFIADFESFTVDENVTIVGVENAMNFRCIQKQASLFEDINALFVSRYPQSQSRDFISWMKSVPNTYLHFGDFDMAGIGIYLNEYRKYLGKRARFFVPPDIASVLAEYGNKKRFDTQRICFDVKDVEEPDLFQLISLIMKEKKGLDQEFYIR
jgi:hypothetical protein